MVRLHALVGQQICRRESAQVPRELIARIFLNIGHEVREDAAVERLTFELDLSPDACKDAARSFLLPSMHERDAVVDSLHHRGGVTHRHEA